MLLDASLKLRRSNVKQQAFVLTVADSLHTMQRGAATRNLPPLLAGPSSPSWLTHRLLPLMSMDANPNMVSNSNSASIKHLLLLPSPHSLITANPTVRATLKCCGGYTVTQADRGENQSMNNQPKYNKRGSHLTEGKTREKSLRFPHYQ